MWKQRQGYGKHTRANAINAMATKNKKKGNRCWVFCNIVIGVRTTRSNGLKYFYRETCFKSPEARSVLRPRASDFCFCFFYIVP